MREGVKTALELGELKGSSARSELWRGCFSTRKVVWSKMVLTTARSEVADTLGAGVAQGVVAVVRRLRGMDRRAGTRGKSTVTAPKRALLIQLSTAGWKEACQ